MSELFTREIYLVICLLSMPSELTRLSIFARKYECLPQCGTEPLETKTTALYNCALGVKDFSEMMLYHIESLFMQ